MMDPRIGSTLYRISGGGMIRYFTPVTVERVTAQQIIVKAPSGREFRHWRKDGYEVGSMRLSWLTTSEPLVAPHMQLSDQARKRR